MNKVIFFQNYDGNEDRCFGEAYVDFIDYAFSVADYFMLVYVNYYGEGYTKIMQDFMKELEPYEFKIRTNPSWAGVLKTYCRNTTYKIVFYKTNIEAKETLKKVNKISDWTCPSFPQDLAFFKGNQCWFYSVGHEKIAAIIHATKEDIEFLEKHNIAFEKDIEEYDHYYDQYDEELQNVTVDTKGLDETECTLIDDVMSEANYFESVPLSCVNLSQNEIIDAIMELSSQNSGAEIIQKLEQFQNLISPNIYNKLMALLSDTVDSPVPSDEK